MFCKLFKFMLNFFKKFCSYIDNHYLKLPFLIGNIFFPLERSRHHSSLHDISGWLQCLQHWRLREITVLFFPSLLPLCLACLSLLCLLPLNYQHVAINFNSANSFSPSIEGEREIFIFSPQVGEWNWLPFHIAFQFYSKKSE